MDWILDHPQLVFLALIVVAFAIRSMVEKRQQSAGDGEAQAGRSSDPNQPAPAAQVDDEEERTRRIQEEIRRKILARQRGEPPPIPHEPLVIFEPEAREEREVEEPEWVGEGPPPRRAMPPPLPGAPAPRPAMAREFPPPAGEGRAMALEPAALLEQQARLLEQLQALRVTRSAAYAVEAARPAPSLAAAGVGAASRVALRGELRGQLGNPAALRRAVLLREILGPPLGLQRGPLQLPRR